MSSSAFSACLLRSSFAYYSAPFTTAPAPSASVAVPPALPAAVTQQAPAQISRTAACWSHDGGASQGTKESDGIDGSGRKDGDSMQEKGGKEEGDVMRRERGGMIYGRERSRDGAVMVVGSEEGQVGREVLQCGEVGGESECSCSRGTWACKMRMVAIGKVGEEVGMRVNF
ncbi:unnamed protein product [Closterium sp. Yama58-4]|nr:unnamed protein product [Closterium sp. Yama58-4]